MYNHFASLIPVPHFSGDVQTLNKEVEMLVKPWWEKVYGVYGYYCSKEPLHTLLEAFPPTG
jgi:hypothetical protein